MNVKPFYSLLSALFLSALTGCNDKPSYAEICNSSPKLCAEHSATLICKNQHQQVVFADYVHSQDATAVNKYHQLIAYERFLHCLSLPLPRRSISTSKQLIVDKFTGEQADANGNISPNEKLSQKVKDKFRTLSDDASNNNNNDHPYLLFFQWSRHGNSKALADLLKKEGTKALDNSTSQFHLAMYYLKSDPDKALSLLFNALTLHKAQSAINTDILNAIASIYQANEDQKSTYVWLKVLDSYSRTNTSSERLKRHANTHQLNEAFLNKVAELTTVKINSGTFKAPKR